MKNQAKLQEAGMKDLYYYIKNGDRSVGTVCLVVQEGAVLARGVSVCSPEDQFLRRKGRAIACGRAIQATHHEHTLHPINHSRSFRYGSNGALDSLKFAHKATYHPKLTGFEKRLVERVN